MKTDFTYNKIYRQFQPLSDQLLIENWKYHQHQSKCREDYDCLAFSVCEDLLRQRVTPSHEQLHRTYGGLITQFDFEGYTSLVSIDDKIRKDRAFDLTCRKDSMVRDRKKADSKQKEEGCDI